ncbi:hypothetical protein [Crenothrix polyspora]|uniref:Uncharacterized protein n=1 Tax=Crenothrix polyspora TaxID=360316 RepID=A0A1R4H537_9GAMM|nr:hypothetical protein [Crenothrix polyspora]SJM91362.1 conserved hypothetical protein [Crenothrix polyspora]
MFLPLRTVILFFLVLLQLIAPLVHAHTGEQIFNTGLHIPGLEAFDHAHNSDTPLLLQSASAHNSEGLLIGINTGLKAKHSTALDDNDSPVYIIPTAAIVKTTLSQFDSNFSPQPLPPALQTLISAHPARAPPQHPLA